MHDLYYDLRTSQFYRFSNNRWQLTMPNLDRSGDRSCSVCYDIPEMSVGVYSFAYRQASFKSMEFIRNNHATALFGAWRIMDITLDDFIWMCRLPPYEISDFYIDLYYGELIPSIIVTKRLITSVEVYTTRTRVYFGNEADYLEYQLTK